MNNITLVGRTGRDPELKYFESGNNVAEFSLAVDRRNKNKDTDWFNCKAWGKVGEIIGQYVKKGDSLCVSGKVIFEKWTDKEGKNQTKAVVEVSGITLIGGRESSDSYQKEVETVPAANSNPQNTYREQVIDDGEIPF